MVELVAAGGLAGAGELTLARCQRLQHLRRRNNPLATGGVLHEGQLLRKAIGWVAENGLGISSDQVLPEAFRPLQEDAFEFGGPGQPVLYCNGILRNPPLDSGYAPCSELANDLFAEDAHKQ